jgi:hypothetical protein
VTAAAPSGVVTFLFTDVEGSTRRWEADADAMRMALAGHDEVLRGATTGRIEAAVGYSEAGQIVLGRGREALPYGIEAWLGLVYLVIGQPERLAELCRAQLARRRDTPVNIRAWLVGALALAGSGGEAMDSADGLIEAAEATGNPSFRALALGA